MVLIVNKLNLFFTNAPHMALYVHTRNHLSEEGLLTVDNFEYFKSNKL